MERVVKFNRSIMITTVMKVQNVSFTIALKAFVIKRFCFQSATWDMDLLPSCYHQRLRRSSQFHQSLNVRTSAFAIAKLLHLNACRSAMGKKVPTHNAQKALKASFFRSQASTFNCEMSDLDQSELKVDVHYTHTPNRDYWLFAWNPFDYTCRDKITSISGNRINSDRRMDIFRDSGKLFNRTSVISSSPTSSPISHNIFNNSQTKLTTSSSSTAQ